MNVPLFIILLIAFGGAFLWLGRGIRHSNHASDFFLAGRKLGLFGLIMTMLATQIGGGALLGASEEAYLRGWSVIFYPLGMVLGLALLGLGYGARMRKLNLTTVPEIFQKIYLAPRLRRIASLLSIISLFLILIGQGIAARKFFSSLGFNGDLLFVIFWMVLIVYTTMGGIAAAVKTDILQASFIIIAFAIAVFAACHSESLSTTFHALEEGSSQMDTPWFSWLILPLLFMLIEQDMGQWCFAAKNSRVVSKAALIASGLLMIFAITPIFFGVLAAQQGITVPQGSSVLIEAVQALTNPLVTTCIMFAVLMALISTANSLLCSVSSIIVCDFSKTNKTVLFSKCITLSVGLFALLFSFMFSHIVPILMFSYELAVCVLFVPVVMAVWSKNPKKNAALLSMTIGGISFILLQIWETTFPRVLISLSLSLIAFLLYQKLSLQKSE